MARVSCRGLDSYIVAGISRDRDFLLMLFSFAVSVTTNSTFPDSFPLRTTKRIVPLPKRLSS
jgi:hypothetical protein